MPEAVTIAESGQPSRCTRRSRPRRASATRHRATSHPAAKIRNPSALAFHLYIRTHTRGLTATLTATHTNNHELLAPTTVDGWGVPRSPGDPLRGTVIMAAAGHEPSGMPTSVQSTDSS